MNEHNEVTRDEYISEDEMDEALDSLIEYIEADAALHVGEVRFADLDAIKRIQAIYRLLQKMTKGSGAKVSCHLHEPFHSMGYIRVTGRNLTFGQPRVFVALAKMASNLDVYPKVDGSIQIDFTFHNITKAV